MYEIDRNAIEGKITHSKFSENSETNKAIVASLIALTRELCEHTQKVNQRLVNAAHAVNHDYHIDDIYTALKSEDESEDEYQTAGLHKMADSDPYRVFLDLDYDEIRSIVGDLTKKKIYTGKYTTKKGEDKEFDYCLEFDNSFLKAQERLFNYAEHYCVKNPVVLSPYSHKSFRVVFDQAELKDAELDFCYKNNNLPVISSGDKCSLYWNIRQYPVNGKTYDGKEPYGDKTKYVYHFKKTKTGRYILPMPVNNQTKIYDIRFISDCTEMVTDHDIDDFIIYDYDELDKNSRVVKERQSKKLLFVNRIDEKMQGHRRIISEGDIERVIGLFREWQNLYCERTDDNGKSVTRYSKKYRTDRKNKVLFNTIKREYIHMNSEMLGKNLFTDYANYVLEYLEYYYPEIEWVGRV